MLAQLLIQFQKPIVVEHALAVNGSRPLINDTHAQLNNDSAAVHRSTRAIDGAFKFDENENSIQSANLFAQDYSFGKWRRWRRKCMCVAIVINFCFFFFWSRVERRR